MDVTLKPEVAKLIEDELKAGRSADASEFIDKAVYHFVVARDLGQAYSRQELEEKIARGMAQIERGETVDGDERPAPLGRGERRRSQELEAHDLSR